MAKPKLSSLVIDCERCTQVCLEAAEEGVGIGIIFTRVQGEDVHVPVFDSSLPKYAAVLHQEVIEYSAREVAFAARELHAKASGVTLQ